MLILENKPNKGDDSNLASCQVPSHQHIIDSLPITACLVMFYTIITIALTISFKPHQKYSYQMEHAILNSQSVHCNAIWHYQFGLK